METEYFLISNGQSYLIVHDGLDEKGKSGFIKKHNIVKNDVYDVVRLVHEMSWPLWLGVCQTGTHVTSYLTGESIFIPHDEGEYELIEEDFEHLYQHLDYKISSRQDGR